MNPPTEETSRYQDDAAVRRRTWHDRFWRRLPRPVRWACRLARWLTPIPHQVGHLSKYRRQSTGTDVPLLEICLLGFGLLVLLTR